MLRKPSPPERLFVALDLEPQHVGDRNVRDVALKYVDDMANTGVVIKLNAVLDACGYDLIDEIHDRGLGVFIDKKFADIPQTMGNYGGFLSRHRPEFVTATVGESPENLRRLRDVLPEESTLLGVLALSSIKDEDAMRVYGHEMGIKQLLLARGDVAREGGCGGIICPTPELAFMIDRFGTNYEYVSPGIRPADVVVKGDDQNPDRVGTPAGAIRAGATRIVVGRPIMNAPNRRDMVERIIAQIASV